MKLTVILGQTCSGKTAMSVNLAKYYQSIGQSVYIVGCDSRQIYSKLNIGTAKISGSWLAASCPHISRPITYQTQQYIFEEIPHFLIDYVNPSINYSLLEFVLDFTTLIESIPASLKPQHVILTGGTGLWAQAIINKYQIGNVRLEYQSEYENIQKSLTQKSLSDLQKIHSELNLAALNESDFANSRRLQNTIIRSKTEGWTDPISYPEFETIHVYAISCQGDELKNRITARVYERIEQGLLAEVINLQYLGSQRLLNLGLEYKQTQLFIEGQISENQWIENLITENLQYAKRQKTWLNKMNLTWVEKLDEVVENSK